MVIHSRVPDKRGKPGVVVYGNHRYCILHSTEYLWVHTCMYIDTIYIYIYIYIYIIFL